MKTQYLAYLKEASKNRAKVLRLHKKGVAKAEIARQFGVTRQRIQAIIRKEESRG